MNLKLLAHLGSALCLLRACFPSRFFFRKSRASSWLQDLRPTPLAAVRWPPIGGSGRPQLFSRCPLYPDIPATAALRSVRSMLAFPDLLATSLVSRETLSFVILDLWWLVKKGYLSFCCLGGSILVSVVEETSPHLTRGSLQGSTREVIWLRKCPPVVYVSKAGSQACGARGKCGRLKRSGLVGGG